MWNFVIDKGLFWLNFFLKFDGCVGLINDKWKITRNELFLCINVYCIDDYYMVKKCIFFFYIMEERYMF